MTADKAKADTQAEHNAPRLYRLTGGAANSEPRVKLMTRVQAKALNSAFTDNRKWLFDPAAEPGEVTDKLPTNGHTFSAVLAKSVHAIALQTLSDAKGTAMRKVKIDGLSENHREWRGLSMCQIIRFCGHRGLKTPEAAKVCASVGLTPARGTLSIQLGKGRKREDLPEINAETAKELLGDLMPASSKADKADGKPKLSKAERKAARIAKRKAESKVSLAA